MAFKCLGLLYSVFFWGILRIMFVTASTKVIRIGDDLQLSCHSQVGSYQTWWFEGKSLANNTKHTNNFDILQISNVSKKNEGIYWCGPSWQQGMNVSVLVGDLPSPPRNLHTTSYEFDKFLHWTSANYTGGLPTHYSVHIHCTQMPNCSRMLTGVLYVPDIISDCDSIKHVDGKNYRCSLQSANIFVGYRATVYAVNELGNSSASVLFCRPTAIHPDTTPAKPVQLTATEVQPGNVRLTWKRKGVTYREITFYRIVYREKGIDNNNKTQTWLKDTQDTTVVINNLNADTTYTFYVWKQFRAINETSTLSTPAVTTLHTKSEDPDQPPQDLQCPAIKENSSVIIVEVSWKAPSKKHHNGPLLFYKISSSTLGSYNKTKVVNATQTNVNLTFSKPHKTIQIYSTACNEHGCSGISNSCDIKGQFDSIRKIPDPSKKIPIIIVGVVLGVVFALIILIIIAFCCFFRKKKTPDTTGRRNLFSLEIDPESYTKMYEDPMNIEDNDDYDRLLV